MQAFDVSGPHKGVQTWIFHRIIRDFVLAICCHIANKQTYILCGIKTFTPFSLLMNLQSGWTPGLCSTWQYLRQLQGGARIIWKLIHTHVWCPGWEDTNSWGLFICYMVSPYDLSNMAASRQLDFVAVGSGSPRCISWERKMSRSHVAFCGAA